MKAWRSGEPALPRSRRFQPSARAAPAAPDCRPASMTRSTVLATIFALLHTVVPTGPAAAQEPIRFARSPDISPDGRLVAFSYLGDIWVVESIGGIDRPVTLHEGHDIYPIFSPD